MDLPDAPLNLPGPTSPEAVADWNEAYVTVESYFCALGLRNKLLLSTCIHRVLRRAANRHQAEPARKPSALAMEEAMRLVAEWFQRVLDIQLPENRLAARWPPGHAARRPARPLATVVPRRTTLAARVCRLHAQ